MNKLERTPSPDPLINALESDAVYQQLQRAGMDPKIPKEEIKKVFDNQYKRYWEMYNLAKQK